jgi:hypothetical protein
MINENMTKMEGADGEYRSPAMEIIELDMEGVVMSDSSFSSSDFPGGWDNEVEI